MTPHVTHTALYFLLLPVFTAIAAIAVGVLFLAFVEPWAPRATRAGTARRSRAAPEMPGPVLPATVLRPRPADIPAVPDAVREPELA